MECLDDKNPFSNYFQNDYKANDILLANIKMIPKVGEKNAQILLKIFKSYIFFYYYNDLLNVIINFIT